MNHKELSKFLELCSWLMMLIAATVVVACSIVLIYRWSQKNPTVTYTFETICKVY